MAGGKKKGSEDGAGGGGKLKPIGGAVLLLVLGLFLGGKVMGGGGEAAGAAEASTTTVPPGHVTALDAVTLNLADGRFLKVAMAIEVAHDAVYPHVAGGHGGGGEDDPTKGFAKELDTMIEVLSHYTYEQLVSPEGKAKAKEELLHHLREGSHEAVADIYFHQFVMQ